MEAETLALDGALAWQVHDRVELLLNGTVYTQTVNDPLISNLEYDEAALTLSVVVTF